MNPGHHIPVHNGVPDEHCIVLEEASKFYGEVLGVNRVSLRLAPGITSLVGPNGSGKTTLLNLVAGLIRPTSGRVTVLGISPQDPAALHRRVGYGTQYDAFPRGATGLDFLRGYLAVAGVAAAEADRLARQALDRVGMVEAAGRLAAGYSKGMRQRLKLALAIAREPPVLLLDEPLNGLDPLARAEIIELFQRLARGGLHLVISSHILHEVDLLSDRVVILDHGYVVAEGDIGQVRSEIDSRPLQVMVRCDRPRDLAVRLLGEPHVTDVALEADGEGLVVGTRDAGRFYAQLQRAVLDAGLVLESMAPADDDTQAVYRYLVTGREDV